MPVITQPPIQVVPQPPYAPQATVTLNSAIPTVDDSGNVVLWSLAVSYSLNGYTANYQMNLVDASYPIPFFGSQAPLTNDGQPPDAYAQVDLLAMCPIDFWNNMFEDQYASVMAPPPPPAITVESDFDVTKLVPLPADTTVTQLLAMPAVSAQQGAKQLG